MTAVKFLALSGETERLGNWLLSLVPGRRAPPRLNRIFDSPDLVVFASPETPHIALEEERGILIGQLFRSDEGCAPIKALNRSESSHAAWSGGRTLLTETWGGYAAFLRDEGALTVLRDPSAAVNVYHCETDGLHAYFSDAEVAADLGLGASEVDEEFLRQWLTYPFLRTSRTGLEGIDELMPGTSRTWRNGKSSVAALWTPWEAVARQRRIFDFEEAASRLRATLLRTVSRQLQDLEPAILELSGGLDSSIVAACLAGAGIPFRAANFVTLMPDGDERDYARIMASALGIPLAELLEEQIPLDLSPAPARALRPPLSPVLQPLNHAFSAQAKASGARSFVTGAGGDNLFCFLSTAAPILDAARDVGLRRSLSTVRDVAELGGCTVWRAGAYAIRKQLRLARRPKWKSDERFLTASGIAAEPDKHPWLEPPEHTPPGKIEHVESLVRAQHFLDPRYPGGETILHPLLNQPVIELCLTIPTWLWLRGGHNRAVARAAFVDLLPEEIILRRTKGRLESMCARAFGANRETLAVLLLDGELAQRGLIDLPGVESYLRAAGPPRDEAYFRVFDLASLELWLRSGRP